MKNTLFFAINRAFLISFLTVTFTAAVLTILFLVAGLTLSVSH